MGPGGVLDVTPQGAPIAANRLLAHLKRMFAWAAGRDLIDASPAQDVERPTPERSRDRVLSDVADRELVRRGWRASK